MMTSASPVKEKLSPGSTTMDMPAVTAMRFICYSEEKKVFNFSLTDEAMKELSQAAEQFALQQTGRSFKTLDFYKSLPKGSR